jgi:uncharacterized membrane protein YcfT
MKRLDTLFYVAFRIQVKLFYSAVLTDAWNNCQSLPQINQLFSRLPVLSRDIGGILRVTPVFFTFLLARRNYSDIMLRLSKITRNKAIKAHPWATSALA